MVASAEARLSSRRMRAKSWRRRRARRGAAAGGGLDVGVEFAAQGFGDGLGGGFRGDEKEGWAWDSVGLTGRGVEGASMSERLRRCRTP